MEKERKLQILKSAQKRFSKHGLAKTTLDEIARDLRIGKATIYYYFTSKEQLYFNTTEWEFNQFLEEIKALFALENTSFNEKLEKYFQLKENVHSKLKLVYELFQYALKEDHFETEHKLLMELMKRETEYIAGVLPVKKEKTELAEYIVFKSWGGMLLSKVKGDAESKNVNNAFLLKEISSLIV